MFGVMTDYDKSTTKREHVSVWSGPFASVWEADGYANHGAKTYSLTTYNGDKVAAKLPEGVTAPRTDENFKEIDAAITSALAEKLGELK